jgi:hypothetical protein
MESTMTTDHTRPTIELIPNRLPDDTLLYDIRYDDTILPGYFLDDAIAEIRRLRRRPS